MGRLTVYIYIGSVDLNMDLLTYLTVTITTVDETASGEIMAWLKMQK